jgi:hypothetical protein
VSFMLSDEKKELADRYVEELQAGIKQRGLIIIEGIESIILALDKDGQVPTEAVLEAIRGVRALL